ncbi:MAG: DEAD/DEAH box helicase [Bacteroidales bacterium]|nr:DEAD/DEAH box helicase [Bacteroidales bacterium]MCF8456171.1 DEAD/DEAH box helicase [Bacteroidales bacterium]
MSFSSLGLSEGLLKALEDQHYIQAYPIQKEAIPAILKGRDVLGIAKTGSGKTASYVLPILMKLQVIKPSKNRHVNVLVLAPTRELAVQIHGVFQLFGSGLVEPIKSLAVFGGVSINPQMIALQNVNVLVATPGRLLELAESNAVNLSEVETLVLDEADKMLNLGFKDEMDSLFALLPKKRQNLLFSATLSEDVMLIHQILLHDPLVIKIEPDVDQLELINQVAYFVSEKNKGPLLRQLIKSKDMKQVLIFVSSIKRADNVANKLRNNGIEAMAIHSKTSQGQRTNLLTKFKYGKLRVLVATDLLSRGIDIEFLPCVINYELPRSPKDYLHRIGRTGRAESPGDAISLITPVDEHHFNIIQKKMGKQITRIDGDSVELVEGDV